MVSSSVVSCPLLPAYMLTQGCDCWDVSVWTSEHALLCPCGHLSMHFCVRVDI